jgi:hypothetical protein
MKTSFAKLYKKLSVNDPGGSWGSVAFIYLKSFMGTLPQECQKRAQRFTRGIGCPAEGAA